MFTLARYDQLQLRHELEQFELSRFRCKAAREALPASCQKEAGQSVSRIPARSLCVPDSNMRLLNPGQIRTFGVLQQHPFLGRIGEGAKRFSIVLPKILEKAFLCCNRKAHTNVNVSRGL